MGERASEKAIPPFVSADRTPSSSSSHPVRRAVSAPEVHASRLLDRIRQGVADDLETAAVLELLLEAWEPVDIARKLEISRERAVQVRNMILRRIREQFGAELDLS